MKRFYFTDKKDEYSRKSEHIIRVYKMRDGVMECVACTSYRPGSTRGATAEAFAALMSVGEIPKKWENSSVTSWSGPGYFFGEVEKHYSIQEID